MKTLLLLILITFPLKRVSAETYQDFESTIWTIDGVPAPSCEVVRFRIQEYARRETEADQIMEWYSPVTHSVEQRVALLDVFRRMPYFYDDRLYEYLEVRHEWRVDLVETEKLKMATKLRTAFSSSKYGWTDPFQGNFPEDVSVEIKLGRIVLKQRMSFQRYCIEDPKIEVKMEGEDVSVILQGENTPELLGRSF